MQKYVYVIIPLTTMFSAQVIKFIIESIKEKRLKWPRLFNGCGGMPSTHTSLVFSLITSVGILQGIDSVFFAISLVFGLIVAYDSMGIRRESEKQAIVINTLMENFLKENPKQNFRKLKEEIGHDPIEVVAGIIFGTLFSALLLFIFNCI